MGVPKTTGVLVFAADDTLTDFGLQRGAKARLAEAAKAKKPRQPSMEEMDSRYAIFSTDLTNGNILARPGIGLALGSVWTIIPVIVALIIAVIRSVLEDKTLQEELPGYQDYVRHVRFRLIPGVF